MNLSTWQKNILIVEDDLSQRLILRMTLEADGYTPIEAENGLAAKRLLDHNAEIRLVITDLDMPEMNGFELIRYVRKTQRRYTYLIVLSANNDKESLIRALRLGADDYLTKPVLPEELKLRLLGAARVLRLESQEELIFSMAKLADYRSKETGYHLERVQDYTRILALDLMDNHPEMDLSRQKAEEISRLSPLHDLGKVAIPDRILNKPGKLTPEEFEIMQTHAAIGGNILKDIFDSSGAAYLKVAYEIARHHHEKWNGRGYPDGLEGEMIPVSARIMALADVYDAMSSKRCYKESFPHSKVKEIIVSEKGMHFDPRIVDSFLRQEDRWLEIRAKYQED